MLFDTLGLCVYIGNTNQSIPCITVLHVSEVQNFCQNVTRVTWNYPMHILEHPVYRDYQTPANFFFPFLKSLPYLLPKTLFLLDFLLQVDNGHCINLQTTYLFFNYSTLYIFKVTLYIELKCIKVVSLRLQLSNNIYFC